MLGSLFAAASLAFVAVPAASATPAITASASVTNHPDTTSASGPGCTSSPGGPVWALDSYTMNISAVPDAAPGKWDVTINDNGTFAGFADPTNCAYGVSHGSFTGLYSLVVTSPTAPVPGDLKGSYNGAISTTTMVDDFFNNAETNVVGGDYNFEYQGGNYDQNSQGITGAIVLDPCTVTIKPIADVNGVLGASGTIQVQASTNEATPPSHLLYLASNLPHSLHIDNGTGLVSGTLTGPTGVSIVTIKVYNTAFGGENKTCVAVTTFKFTVSLTAPTPTPTPTPSGTPGLTGVPTGGVQTGGGLPSHDYIGEVIGLILLLIGFGIVVIPTIIKIQRNH